jgi:tetratricopeptide (TPR) repeat protein
MGTLGLVFLAIAGFAVLDTFLAGMERNENRAKANRLTSAGIDLMRKAKPADAAEQFKASIAVDRENPLVWLDLGEAQLAAGDLAEAETTLGEVLKRDSTSGEASLTLARVLVKEGRIPEAISIYHRSIYGHWEGDAEAQRVKVRLELVELLAQHGSQEELLAELLPLLDVAPGNIEERMHLANLFLKAGSGQRAAEIFHEILRRQPQDAAVYDGLGQAEFLRGNYLTALTDFEDAANLKPLDKEISDHLTLCSEVLALDPMRRGIGTDERLRRSAKMVKIASDALARCGVPLPEIKTQRGLPPAEAMDENLRLAEDLWKTRERQCRQPASADEEPLRLVLARISQ